MKLNYIGQFDGQFGIPIHATEFAKALRHHVNLDLIQLFENRQKHNIDPDLADLKIPEYEININNPNFVFYYPSEFINWNFSTKLNIGYYIFENEIISKNDISCLNQMDIVCTASKWGCDVLAKNGVTSKIWHVPGGVDTTRFNCRFKDKAELPIKFLHIGKYEARKGNLRVVQAFNEAFRGSDDVQLTLMVSNIFTKKNGRDLLDDANRAGILKYPTRNIRIIDYAEDIVPVYDDHDIAVFAPGAEGIGLPITEAMACGLLVIAPQHTGISEYLARDVALEITEFDVEPVYDKDFFPNSGQFGTWKFPTVEALVDRMLTAYVWASSDLYEWQYITTRQLAINKMKQYSWDNAAQEFLWKLYLEMEKTNVRT